jgi:glucosamine--fructose-6-phosphate aminotransferase (isomerizing)
MCGIIARVDADPVAADLVEGLSTLEYRGYDSAGIAVLGSSGLSCVKTAGEITDLRRRLETGGYPDGTVGVGHTRWSTHGPPTDANAHPHTDCTGRVAVVHNGIIDNHDRLRRELRARGHEFSSDTDSEVMSHLLESHLDAGDPPEEAFRRAVARLEGSYALAAVFEGSDTVFAARSGSPLVLGVAEDGHLLASDVPAFLDVTDEVVYLQDGDLAVVGRDGYRLYGADGEPVERPVERVNWAAEDARKGEHEHFMLKEIHEQPTTLTQALEGRIGEDGTVSLEEFPPGAFESVSGVHLVGCGTSYHAALYAERLLIDHGLPAQAFLASEYVPVGADRNLLVVGITQSGETADTLEALRAASGAGARTLALTNVVGSTAARETDETLYIRAGPEIGVAATKTFVSQLATLLVLADRLTRDVGTTPPEPAALQALRSLPKAVESVTTSTEAAELARKYHRSEAFFFIGRGLAYPVALEGALKLKEISYRHAEGFPAGELKHGPLALVTEDTPVFAVFTGTDDGRTLSNVREVQARGAPVVGVAPAGREVGSVVDHLLSVPETHPLVAAVPATVQLQLLSYHVADLLERPIDKPRNLAKSVTVE